MREIVESVLRALHRHVTADKPMSVTDCYRARTLVAEARADASGSVEAGGRRDPASQPSSTT